MQINPNLVVDAVYPIGSIYMTMSTVNPSVSFGGTWEQIAQGRTLVGVNEDDTDFAMVNQTGGSKYLQKHGHAIVNLKSATTFSTAGTGWAPQQISGVRSWKNIENTDITVGETGTGNSGNLQPYLTCFIWQRTA